MFLNFNVEVKIPKKSSFDEEISFLIANSHPRYKKFLGFIEYQNSHALVFLRTIDQPLKVFIKTVDLSIEEKIKILILIVEVLCFNHSKGLFLNPTPKTFSVSMNNEIFLIDFEKRLICEYSAPEVLLGAEPNELSDLWAFGMVGFFVLFKEKPFFYYKISTIEMILAQILCVNLRPKTSLDLDEKTFKVLKILSGLWELDPLARKNMQHVYKELKRLIN